MNFLNEIQKLNPHSNVVLFSKNDVNKLHTLYIDNQAIRTFSKEEDLSMYLHEQLMMRVADENSCKAEDLLLMPFGEYQYTLKAKDKHLYSSTTVSNDHRFRQIEIMIAYLYTLQKYIVFYCCDTCSEIEILSKINEYMKLNKLSNRIFVICETGVTYHARDLKIVQSKLKENQLIVNETDERTYQFRNGKLTSYTEEKKFDSTKPFTIYEKISDWNSDKDKNEQIVTMNDAKFHYVRHEILRHSQILPNNFVLCNARNDWFIVINSQLKSITELKYIVVENDQIDIPQLFIDYPGKFDAAVKFDGSIYTVHGAILMSKFDKCMKSFEFTNVYTQKKYDFVVAKSCTRTEHHPDIYEYVNIPFNSAGIISYFNQNFGKMKYIVSNHKFSSIFQQNTTGDVGFEFTDSVTSRRMKVGENGLIEIMSDIQTMESRLKNIEEKLAVLLAKTK